jgi:hypothetical protein
VQSLIGTAEFSLCTLSRKCVRVFNERESTAITESTEAFLTV